MATNPAAANKGTPAPKPAPVPGTPGQNPVVPNANVPPPTPASRATAPVSPPPPVGAAPLAPPPPAAPMAATPPPAATAPVTEGEKKKGRKKKEEGESTAAATEKPKDDTPKWSRPQLKKLFDHRRAPHMLLEKGIVEQIPGMTRRYYRVKEGQKMPTREEFDKMGVEHFGGEDKFQKYRVKRPRKSQQTETAPAAGTVTAPQTTANASGPDDDDDDDDEE